MDIIRKAIAGCVTATELTCLHVDGLPPTVRIIKTAASTLVLVVAPIEHTRTVLAAFGSAEPCVYGMIGHGVFGEFGLVEGVARFGSTVQEKKERWRRHLANPPVPAASSMMIVAGRTADILTPDLARALESELARRTQLAGGYRVVGSYAFHTLSAPTKALVDHWVNELRLMLIDAGLPVLEEVLEGPTAAPEPLTELRAGYGLRVPADVANLPGVRRWRLEFGAVRATALCGPDWTVLLPGATAPARELPSHQLCLKRKRAELVQKGVLRKKPGRRDLVELTRALQVPSRVNGGRLLSGTNLSGQEWRLVG